MKEIFSRPIKPSTIIVSIILSVTFIALVAMSEKPVSSKEALWWREFTADTEEVGVRFSVQLDEYQYEGERPVRSLHISVITNNVVGITGYGFGDNKWKKIIFHGYYSSSGENVLVRRQNSDGWRWHPCEEDRNQPPISSSEINRAIQLLDKTLSKLDDSHLTTVQTGGKTIDLKMIELSRLDPR